MNVFGFDVCLEQTEATLVASLALTEIPIAPVLARCTGRYRDEPAVIETRAYRGPSVRYARFATLQGNTLDIGNALVLPRDDRPVLGADFVSLGGEAAMIALDLTPMSIEDGDRARRLSFVRTAHARYATELPPAGDLPDWCRRWFSPYALYTRFPVDRRAVAIEATNAYVEAYRRAMESPAPASDREDMAHASQRSYLRDHREEDRGLRLMNKIFGSEWTTRYVHEVLLPDVVPS